MGRPTTFTQEIVDEICERIADGESLRSICLSEAMPAKSTVFKWLLERDSFSDQYARAREAQADSLFDDVLMISDTATPEEIAVARLRVDSRKWMAGKLRPKKYGDKITSEISGPDGGAIETKETGAASAKLARFLDGIAERSGTAGEPDA